jgi:4-amino-4-deoxy-L-arabinose transferase-like glycosyltransferase
VSNITDRLFMVAIFGIASFLRLWQINTLGYNSDEAVYAGQGAAIAADPVLKEIFPVFRAHPLLFQFVLAVGFRFGVNDLVGRLLSVLAGLATVYLVYRLGTLLYSRRAGMVAALIMGLMPYHVVVTRQVLLDGPMVLCATLSLYLMARFAVAQRPIWFYAAGAAMGLTFLAKETSIVLLGSIYAFLALSPEIRVRLRDLVLSMACMALVIIPFPLSLILAGGGGSKTSQNYVVWQLFRRPNHDWTFYPTTVPLAIGPLVILVALLGLWLLRGERTWREKLLVAWIVVPVAFFQLWPTKGFQYLLPIAPAVAILAGRTLARWSVGRDMTIMRWHFRAAWVQPLATGLVALSLLVASWLQVQTVISDQFLAGSGGVPGGREAGEWLRKNVPEGATLMTVGPSMANILAFYGHRNGYGLSISPNPLHRNPSYLPILNPDLQIRSGNLQYLVWDSFSASRSSFFSDGLLRYVKRYHGRAVHTESVTVTTPDGSTAVTPIIIIYEVRP